MAHLEPPQPKQGWLDKRGEIGLKQWSRRWFSLDESGVQYFMDREMKLQKGSVSSFSKCLFFLLSTYTLSFLLFNLFLSLAPSSYTHFRFSICLIVTSIALQSITTATSSAPPATEILLASAGAYFQINTNETKNNRIYYLYCESKEETTHWIIAINYWRDYASGSGNKKIREGRT